MTPATDPTDHAHDPLPSAASGTSLVTTSMAIAPLHPDAHTALQEAQMDRMMETFVKLVITAAVVMPLAGVLLRLFLH
jgi:hypothetical protein